MSAPVSPLCRVLEGCSTIVIFKREKTQVKSTCGKLVIFNRLLKFNLSKVKPNYSPFYMREAPSATYGGISIDPISGLSELLQRGVRRTCLAVFAVLTTDPLFWLEGSFSVRLRKPA